MSGFMTGIEFDSPFSQYDKVQKVISMSHLTARNIRNHRRKMSSSKQKRAGVKLASVYNYVVRINGRYGREADSSGKN